jgi:hypothetical protein
LAHYNVLTYLNTLYSESDIWLTYGQFAEHPSGVRHDEYSKPFSQEVIAHNSFRKVEQLPMSHLRTFYAWLFKSIKLEDVLYQGDFYPMTCDKVILACCVEMAAKHHYCVPDVLYIYNNTNQLSDHRIDWRLQWTIARHVLDLPPYTPLDIPKKIDEFEELDRVSLVLFSQNKPTLQDIESIAACKNNYDEIMILYPDTEVNFLQHIKKVLEQIKSRYVQISTQWGSLHIDTALCARYLKKTQVDVLLGVPTQTVGSEMLSKKKLPKVATAYPIYALYPQNYSLQEFCTLSGACIWRKDALLALQDYCKGKDAAALQNCLAEYIYTHNKLCLFLDFRELQ